MKKYQVAMIGLFDHEPDFENNIFKEKIKVHQSLKDNSQEFEKYEGLLLWHTDEFSAQVLSKHFPNVKGIVRIGMGYDNVDLKQASKQKITVSNVPDYGVEEVADSAMCFILGLLRKTFTLSHETTQLGKWPGQGGMKGALRVKGKNLGILGLGSIGKCVALRAKAFGMNVSFYDPYVKFGMEKSLGIDRFYSLEEFLGNADVVSVHTWLSKETTHLINEKTIKFMKKGSFLVNTARGPVVQEKALVQALKSGHLAGAALDVLEVEPYKNNLKDVPNLILTPHSAFYSEEGFKEMREKAALELKRILDGKAPWYCVNSELLKEEGK